MPLRPATLTGTPTVAETLISTHPRQGPYYVVRRYIVEFPAVLPYGPGQWR